MVEMEVDILDVSHSEQYQKLYLCFLQKIIFVSTSTFFAFRVTSTFFAFTFPGISDHIIHFYKSLYF